MKNKVSDFFIRNRFFLMAFIIPFIIMLIANIAMGVFPFGEKSVLIIDSYHQYAPFFSEFYDKIVNGGSLFYTWNGGMGINFWTIVTYYLASPLNILVLLFPREWLLEAYALIIMLKVSLSGLTFAYYIHKHYKKYDITIVYCSIFYALSGWTLGYNWNIMWLDCIVLFPLIILGLECLVKEGKGLLYGITLGCCIFFNYYISIMICIFLVIYFFVLFFQKRKKNIKLFFSRGFMFAGYSLLAGGLGAVMLLPTMFTLMQTHSAESKFPETIKFYDNFIDILSQHFVFVEPTDLSGMPNLYCGVLIFMFVILYLFRKNTPARYKVSRVVLLVFMVFSCNVNVLDYIWHGLHYPNSLPNRFTFIYIFLALTMMYEVFLTIRQYELWQYFAAFLASVVFVVVTNKFGKESREIYTYIITICFLWVYLVIFSFYKIKSHKRALIEILLCFVLVFEVAANCIFGLCMNGTVNRTNYNARLEDAAAIREVIGDDGDDGLYRTEIEQFRGRNNVMWLGYKGMSMFTSTLSDGLDELMDNLGYFAAVNKFSYEGATRLTDDIFGIKYLVSEKEAEKIRGFRLLQQIGKEYLYMNTDALPIAFMVDQSYEQWNPDSEYPWENQNSFVRYATGISESLFDIEYITGEPTVSGGSLSKEDEYSYYLREDADAETTTVEYTYTPTYPKERYIYYEASHMDKLKVTINGETRSYSDTRGHIVDLGNVTDGDTVTLSFVLDSSYSGGHITMALFGLNVDVYEQVCGQLQSETMTVVDYSDTSILGSINVSEPGIMFTSIPYDSGWKIKVDGKEVEAKALLNSLMYVELEPGEHIIEMNYMPSGFLAGLVISMICLFIFIIIYFRSRVRRINVNKNQGFN